MWALLGIGVLFLVLGIVMLAAGLLFIGGRAALGPEGLLGVTLTGGIFVLVSLLLLGIGLFMHRSAARAERLRRDGLRGRATITDIGETSMSVNDRPVLDLGLMVTVPGRSPYPVRHRMVMPWNALGRIGMGQAVPVRVDPRDNESVLIEWTDTPATVGAWSPGPGTPVTVVSAAGTPWVPAGQDQSGGPEAVLGYLRSMGVDVTGPIAAAISGAMTGQPGPAAQPGASRSSAPGTYPAVGSAFGADPVEMRTPTTVDLRAGPSELRDTGLRGRAGIKGTQDLGVTTGDSRLLRLDLEITLEGRAPYPLGHVTMVPTGSLPRVTPGQSLAVLVDPANTDNVAIDWDGA